MTYGTIRRYIGGSRSRQEAKGAPPHRWFGDGSPIQFIGEHILTAGPGLHQSMTFDNYAFVLVRSIWNTRTLEKHA